MIVTTVIEQHAEDVMVCALRRAFAIDAGHVDLVRLARLDELMMAHLDGLRVAGGAGLEVALERMSADTDGSAFAPTWLSIERKDRARLRRVLLLFGAAGRIRSEMGPALRWMVSENRAEPESIFDADPTDEQRCLALMSFGPRQRDRSLDVLEALANPSPAVRAEAARTAGRLGLVDLLDRLSAGLADPNPLCRFWFAASAVLLGNRGAGLDVVSKFLLEPGPLRRTAWMLAGPVLDLGRAKSLLGELAVQPGARRQLVAAIGAVGSGDYLAWLIRQMAEPAQARGAGESFSRIAGLDLARLDLDRAPFEAFQTTPDEDATNDDVDMNPDDGLPWPDPVAIGAWWQGNQHRFPAGQRFFMGSPPSMAGCLDVLKTGYQRQRSAAAIWLMLLRPGTPLFPVDAPVWRQRLWLEPERATHALRSGIDPGHHVWS